MYLHIRNLFMLLLSMLLMGSMLTLIPAGQLQAQPGTINSIAGTGSSGFSGDGGPALAAQFSYMTHLAFDAVGNLFIADKQNHRIRRIDAASGIVTTVVGPGIPGSNTSLYEPNAVAFDAAVNLYIGEYGGSRILKMDATTGTISLIGTGIRGYAGDGGPVSNARFNLITDLLFDDAGNLYISDLGNQRIRRVDAITGVITTIAGTGVSGYTGDGGPATAAKINHPLGLAFNADGDLFFGGLDHRVRKINGATGIITTVVGTGIGTYSGDGGAASNASVNQPETLVFDQAGNLFIADTWNHCIRKVDAVTGIISTVVGTGMQGFSGDGGPAIDARIARPIGMVFDSGDNLYIASYFNHRIRKVEAFCTDPIPTFSATAECEGEPTGFTDLSTNLAPGATYEWDIDDDGTVDYTTAGDITHIYAAAGSYTARLIISQGGCSASATQTVTVYENPVVNAGANQTVSYGYPDQTSATAYLSATANGGTAPYTYAWTPAGVLDDATSATPVATLGNTTTTFTVTVTDANGCTASDQVTVCVNDVVCKVMNTNYKVNVCHIDEYGNPHTLCVAMSAVASHLAHGDQLGTCESANEPCVDPGSARRARPGYPAWQMKAYPNPFSYQTRIEFFAPESEQVRMEVFDMQGTLVRTVFDEVARGGQLNEAIFDGGGLADGMYLVRMTTPIAVGYAKVMLMR